MALQGIVPITDCYLCGEPGEILYTRQYDRLFDVPGWWDVRICPACELAWLDPRPLPEEINNLYTEYCTHQPISFGSLESSLAIAKQNVNKAIWAAWLGYYQGKIEPWYLALGYIVGLVPPIREAATLAVMNLRAKGRGKLVDVGCGNGKFLALMRDLGWDVLGVEPDVKAANIAKEQYGLMVIPTTLEGAKLPDTSVDVITMPHVIEPVSDPIGLLAECRRILRPGGMVILITPNLNSLGCRIFKDAWRGWEVPRHFFVLGLTQLAGVSPNIWRVIHCHPQYMAIKGVGFRFNCVTPMYFRLVPYGPVLNGQV